MPISKEGKLYFTDEQYNTARYDSSALEYARAQGYNLVKKGKYHTLKEHDSMVFTEHGTWFWNSRNIRGGAIEFMTHFEQLSYQEAITTLAGENISQYQRGYLLTPEAEKIAELARAAKYAKTEQPETTPVAFSLPKRAENHKRLFAYLTKSRCIDSSLVSQLLKDRKIYQSEKTNNAVFVFQNNNNEVVGAFERGTMTDKSFMRLVEGSDKTNGYFYFGGSSTATVACVFEASIDALSYATLQKKAGNNDLSGRFYIATGGTGDSNILAFLSGHPQVRSVVLCHDNDIAGENMASGLGEKLRAADYQVSRNVPIHNDFNDDLCQMVRQENMEQQAEMDFDIAEM